MGETAASLTLQLLAWIDREPRTYAETMEAWRSSCPRMPVWEDAAMDGLLQVESVRGTPMGTCPVSLTPRGRDILNGAAATLPGTPASHHERTSEAALRTLAGPALRPNGS